MKNISIGILIAASIVGFLTWSAKHDDQVAEAAAKYEKCVLTTFRTTPAGYYQEHGEYPVCTTAEIISNK